MHPPVAGFTQAGRRTGAHTTLSRTQLKAAAASMMPPPSGSVVLTRCVAVPLRHPTTCAAVAAGNELRMSSATPATSGAEKEVPLTTSSRHRLTPSESRKRVSESLRMSTPGMGGTWHGASAVRAHPILLRVSKARAQGAPGAAMPTPRP